MALATNTCLLLFFFLLVQCSNALFSNYSFKTQEEAQAFEASLLHQACFNTSDREACISRLDTGRGGRAAPAGPVPILRAALRDTIDEAVSAVEAVAGLASQSNDTREEMAVHDCVELLGYSVDELGWSLDAMTEQEPVDPEPEPGMSSRGKRAEDDLHAWLSAALGNQDTCMDGFHGTDGRLLRHVEVKVAQLTQLVSNLLAMHKRLRSIMPMRAPPKKDATRGSSSELPPWVAADDAELMRAGRKAMHVDVVVAQDGSGRYRSVSEAVERAPSHSKRRYVIYVKRGEYRENVEVKKRKMNIAIIGEGIGETVITGSRSISGGWTTFRSATFAVSGSGFIARDITFRNTAGPLNHQAVALRVDSDRSAFFRCSIEGYQDTLYAHSLRQFYRDCNIYGTVDFIFGNAIAVIQHCNIYTQALPPGQAASITAQGRRDANQNTGFSIHNCFVDAKYPTYLGRPWKPYSRTVYMQSYLGPRVQTQGWLQWAGGFGLDTVFYGEYMNYGPGASLGGRVKWPGYHVIMDPSTASYFTVRRFINGLSWLPSTGVTFTADLIK